MTPFTYQRPTTLADAMTALAAGGPGTKILAGGQSLLLALKERQARPSGLVAIRNLPELQGVSHLSDGALRIGPATTYATLSRLTLAGWHGELATVAGNLADRSVRNIGTIGGGVCQADPRYDMPTFLSGAAASFTLASARGEREVSTDAFFNPLGGTTIAADEILTAVTLPPLAQVSALAFEKFCFRSFEAAIVNFAGSVKLDESGQIAKIRFAAGGIAKAPVLALQTAESLVGTSIAALDVKDVAAKISNEVLPPETASDRRRQYQAELIISLAQRALHKFSQAGAKP